MDHIIPIKAAFDAYSNRGGVYIKAGDYSVTDILNPPRIIHLRNRHKDELPPQSVEELLKAFQGNAWHSFLERQLRAASNKEEWRNKFLIESKFWELVNERKISGKLDCYYVPDKALYDFKVTSTYKAVFGDFDDWETQLNCYAWFLGKCKFPVETIRIVCIHPDWKKFEMMRDHKYPREPIHEIQLKVWDKETQTRTVTERITSLKDSENLSDNDLPFCTDSDMWLKAPVYALWEPGKQRASRVLATQEEMDKYIAHRAEKGKPVDPAHWIQVRLGERTRCDGYCQVSTFCNQYAEYCMEQMAGGADEEM